MLCGVGKIGREAWAEREDERENTQQTAQNNIPPKSKLTRTASGPGGTVFLHAYP